MRIELNENTDNSAIGNAGDMADSEQPRITKQEYSSLREEKKALKKERKAKFGELSFKGKLQYIWDYYKLWFAAAIIVVVAGSMAIKDVRENSRPVYIYVEMLNSYFSVDETNTIDDDFVRQYNIDPKEYKFYIDKSITLQEDMFDTMMMANQQKLMALYMAGDLDVVIGPVATMEGSANYDCYGDLSNLLPQSLIDELIDREYEFYYFDPSSDEIESFEGDDRGPYFAGIYLDNCSYLNNNGEYGAYPVAVNQKDRPIFTIAANAPHVDHAIEFLEFLVKNR